MTALATYPTHSVIQRLPAKSQSAINVMAQRCQVEPGKLFEALAATVFKGATNEEMLTLVVVANQYRLNPFLRQIYAFPKKGGGIVPVVGIDGWATIVNEQQSFDGCDFSYEDDDGPFACTCTMHVKGRSHPTRVTEYFSECSRGTEPWKQMPRRMLRHKAFMQASRLAFGLGGIYDEDEARDVAGNVVASTGDGNMLTPAESDRRSTRAEAIVDRLKAADAPAAERAPAADAPQVDALPTWADLANIGITYIIEDAGIAVQNVEGETLRPDGVWAIYTGWTVQPGTPEQALVAREMAVKSLKPITLPAAAAAPANTVADAKAAPAATGRPRSTPPKA